MRSKQQAKTLLANLELDLIENERERHRIERAISHAREILADMADPKESKVVHRALTSPSTTRAVEAASPPPGASGVRTGLADRIRKILAAFPNGLTTTEITSRVAESGYVHGATESSLADSVGISVNRMRKSGRLVLEDGRYKIAR